ncbi:DEAD/DEAH box helicase family protein [Dysgonomonas sp.]|uniref:DEAD/DEAH box helicase family protein n=1 Tax=Dysgonomonas sp. TaxID=1891233 RepID=UPI002CBA4BCE|nr:DEAD/DEAH box helicase family protein [Dysgonomonas sp.]HMM04265.1 DEAD/DEAH box helicase family protein [Dysgonomonas sp.]
MPIKTHEIKLKLNDYLDKAFKVIPTNAFIHKGRTGIGGTHLELKANRNSIATVPTKGIITDKINSKDENGNLEYPNLFPVMGGVTPNDIKEYLSSNIPYKKLITTPDSFYKIIEASKGNLHELYRDYFLLFDEAHSIITESYRESMIKAFELQFNFKSRTFISATPFYFSDPRMKELKYYRITFDEPLGKINIIHAKSVKRCVNEFLTNTNQFNSNLHIFLNSVTEIAEAIERAEIKDCNIHCSDKEDNLEKIGKFFKPQPIKGQYKKINFYTTSHFEGWNLEDINPTIILVTDANKYHTKVGISNKGVQAVGRQRIKPNDSKTIPTIYHITNHRKKKIYKPMERITKDYMFDAEWEIDNYNEYIEACKLQEREPSQEKTDFVQKYATINADTDRAEICHTKIDQFINESACDEEFNHIDYIQEAWQRAGFETDLKIHSETLNKNIKRKTKKSVKEILEDIEALESTNSFVFGNQEQITKLKNKYPVLYDAYKKLTKAEIKSTNYVVKNIEKILILKNNKDAEIRVLKFLPHYFTIGERYTKAEVKDYLQEIYDKTGYIKNASAEQINHIWYDARPCKIKDNTGTYHNGFEIQRMILKVRAATK